MTVTATGTARSLVWHGGRDFGIEAWPLPEPGPADVVIRVTGCGLCGSDLHTFAGEALDAVPPRVFGHEPAGVVEHAGERVPGFAPGDLVTWEPSLPCGACPQCRDGEDGICEARVTSPGAFADRTVVPAGALYHVPDGLAPGLAVLTEPVACAVHAYRRAGLQAGDAVTVVGAGAIGLILVALARRAGARTIVVSEPSPVKRAVAGQLGADVVVDPDQEPVAEATRRATGRQGADVVFDAAGTPASLRDATATARAGGQVVLVGLGGAGQDAALPLFDLMRRDLTIHAVWMRRFSFQRALQLLPALNLDPLITDTVPLADYERAVALLRGGDAIKVVIQP